MPLKLTVSLEEIEKLSAFWKYVPIESNNYEQTFNKLRNWSSSTTSLYYVNSEAFYLFWIMSYINKELLTPISFTAGLSKNFVRFT